MMKLAVSSRYVCGRLFVWRKVCAAIHGSSPRLYGSGSGGWPSAMSTSKTKSYAFPLWTRCPSTGPMPPPPAPPPPAAAEPAAACGSLTTSPSFFHAPSATDHTWMVGVPPALRTILCCPSLVPGTLRALSSGSAATSTPPTCPGISVAGICCAATVCSKVAMVSASARREGSAVNTRATPSAQPVTTSPFGSVATAHTGAGCAITCRQVPSAAEKIRSVRSSPHAASSPPGSVATEYTNESDAWIVSSAPPSSDQRRSVPSLDAETSPIPGTRASARTTSAWPESVAAHTPPRQMRIVRSPDADAIPAPSGSGSTAHTACACPVSTSDAPAPPSRQTRTVLSHEPETMSPPSVDATHATTSVCPSRMREGVPASSSQTITCLSFEPETTWPVGPSVATAPT
mmetsp:Transcript_7467/g.19097  ORF Transcript_7467/g.19097 Transcript_7467/m.19097 type:complete len:402 (+) Transcript_7467:189-1394(+)